MLSEVQLKRFKRATHNIREQQLSSIANICTNVGERFRDIKESEIFENFESILDTFTWTVNRDCSASENDVIGKICKHFKELLVKDGCDIIKVPSDRLALKTQVVPIIKNPWKSNFKYLEI